MDIENYVISAVMSVATHFARRGIEFTADKAKTLIKAVCKKDPLLRSRMNIDEMAEKIKSSASTIGQVSYNQETLARFLEIPATDLSNVTPENIDIQALYDHVKLEGEFKQWLDDWGYITELGCELAGLRQIEYTPDVYGQLANLHGQFEICINFVCDIPPNEDRVYALLGKIEAYAEARKSFSYGDVFMVITPSNFTPPSVNAIGLQNEQEDYSIIQLDGGDIFLLESAKISEERIEVLRNKIVQAEEETKRSKIKRKTEEQE